MTPMNSSYGDRILAKDIRINNDTRITGINNNDLIIGPSGAGKTRSYVIPNLLNASENLIVADTKGNLYTKYKKHLEEKGYSVMCLDFVEPAKSPWGYNPLSFIRKNKQKELLENRTIYSERDVKKVAFALSPALDKYDMFWDNSARLYLACLINYVLNFLPVNEHSLSSVYEIYTHLGTEEMEVIFNEACSLYPESSFARQFQTMRQNRTADKMDASIKGFLGHNLEALCYSDTECFFGNPNQLTFKEFSKGKTALFLTISDSDRSNDTLVNLFYTQALQYFITHADDRRSSRLEIPVRFILDDFSTNTKIENFDNIISVVRSRDIYVSIIIQSISQLEGLYGSAAAQTIINNCDTCLFLGGQDVKTAEYFSAKLNKTPYTILNLPLDSAYLFVRGQEPRQVEKYILDEQESDDKTINTESEKTSDTKEKICFEKR